MEGIKLTKLMEFKDQAKDIKRQIEELENLLDDINFRIYELEGE